MPRLPELRAPVLRDLESQLRFAPREALIRDIERTEVLAADIDPNQAYPMEWVIFRITGYRPDKADSAIRGDSLLADLSALAERLCAAAELTVDSLEGAFLSIEQLEARWHVSRSTINRHRKRGLVARRVRGDDGKERLAFSVATVERHEAAHARELRAAAAYSRFDASEAARMIRRASRYARAGLTLNEAAARIAERYERSHEGVRQLLRRQEQGSAPIFGERGPLSEREHRFVQRAVARAIEPARIAEHLDRSGESVRRAIDDQRAQVLIEIDRSGTLEVPPGIWDRADDSSWIEEVLQAAPAREGLDRRPPRDLLELIEGARGAGAPNDAHERSRLLAWHGLRARAATLIRALDSSSPSASAMDRAETDIRWAALLKIQLSRARLAQVVEAVEGAWGVPASRMRPVEAIEAIMEGVRSVSTTLDSHDPGGPLGAPLALGVASALARRSRSKRTSGLATPLLGQGVGLPAWEPVMAPRLWVLLGDERLGRALGALDEESRQLLEERFGLSGRVPSTLAELGARRGLRPMHVARRLRRAMRAAHAHARAAS